MKKKIKINFCDWWPGFNPIDNYFYNLLKEEFDIEISNNPDFLFFSVFGNNHQHFKGTKISYIGENIAPTFKNQNPQGADWSFSFDETTDKNYQLKHYLLYDGYYDLVNKKIDETLVNRKFCSFVVSNGNSKLRNDFFLKLSKYKKVDSGGSFFNNIGYKVSDKRKFQSEYKFSITFENNAYRPEYPYYITEKPFESMCVNSIPIYRGGSKICEDFNTKSFINFHDFKSDDDMIDYIIYLDQNDNEYMKVMEQPWFPNNNQIPDNNKLENIKSFLYKIFE
jgi:hypothetical protein